MDDINARWIFCRNDWTASLAYTTISIGTNIAWWIHVEIYTFNHACKLQNICNLNWHSRTVIQIINDEWVTDFISLIYRYKPTVYLFTSFTKQNKNRGRVMEKKLKLYLVGLQFNSQFSGKCLKFLKCTFLLVPTLQVFSRHIEEYIWY